MSLDVHQSKPKIILAARTRNFPAPQREFLSNEDDGNGNGKKQMHDYDVKMPTFTIYGGLERKTRIFFFLLVNLETVASEFRLLRISPTFDK